MKGNTYRYLLGCVLVVGVGLLGACTGEKSCKNEGGEAKTQTQVHITRLEEELHAANGSAKALAFLQKHPDLTTGFFFSLPGQDTAAVVQMLTHQAADKYRDTMLQEVMQTYPTLHGIESGLGDLFANVSQQFPGFRPPHVYTLVSGFDVDLFYQNGLLLIGLEFFMPATAHYEPPLIPQYIRRRLRPYTVVPRVAQVLSTPYNQAFEGKRMVDEMIRWGKTYYFIEQMLPCEADSNIIGYPAATLAEVKQMEGALYEHFVTKKLFFNDQPQLINKYTGERPNTPEIGDRCPGRIGQYMGWQLVRKWAKEKNLDLRTVMGETDADKIFNEARWRGAE